MIKALIIDDERDARFLLRNLLEQKFSDKIEILDEADDVETGIKAIIQHEPELVFLDIKMPQGTGFDLLSKLDSVNFEIIFITAYDKFAVKAFEFSAFGYLMKPIKEEELKDALLKLDKRLNGLNKGADKRLKVLVENFGDDPKMSKIVISNVGGFKVIALKNIIRLEGDGNYTNFILMGQKKLTSTKILKEYQELLNDHGFFRIHQSTIVNLRHVTGYNREDGGNVETSDGCKLKLSRYRKESFMKRFL